MSPLPAHPVIGFDLDMTLVDSAAGIVATLADVLSELTDLPAPGLEQVWPWIGLPLTRTVEALAPGVDALEVVRRYRAGYARIGVPTTTLMPGAGEAIRAVRAAGGSVLVVSAKALPGVLQVLAQVGLDAGPLRPDHVVGDLFGAAKGHELAGQGAHAYVGDHPADVEAARVAGALAVGVATGPHPAGDLAAAGADVVLPDLLAFAGWLAARAPA